MRELAHKGWRSTAWRYLALSSTTTMRFPRAMPEEPLQEARERDRIELLAHGAYKLVGIQTDRAEAGHQFAGGGMYRHRILDLGRHPHRAATMQRRTTSSNSQNQTTTHLQRVMLMVQAWLLLTRP